MIFNLQNWVSVIILYLVNADKIGWFSLKFKLHYLLIYPINQNLSSYTNKIDKHLLDILNQVDKYVIYL